MDDYNVKEFVIEQIEQVTLDETESNIIFVEKIIKRTIKNKRTLITNYVEMKPCKIFDENDSLILIDENNFLSVRRRESKASSNVKSIRKTTVERYRKIAEQLNKFEKIKNVVPNSDVGGIYIFVANRDISLDLFELFKRFVVIQLNGSKLVTNLMSSPKINLDMTNNHPLIIKKGEIIYVGESKHLTSRYYQHLNDELTGTASMKFGLREEVFGVYSDRYFDTYIIRENESNNRTELERFIRNYYHPRFGK